MVLLFQYQAFLLLSGVVDLLMQGLELFTALAVPVCARVWPFSGACVLGFPHHCESSIACKCTAQSGGHCSCTRRFLDRPSKPDCAATALAAIWMVSDYIGGSHITPLTHPQGPCAAGCSELDSLDLPHAYDQCPFRMRWCISAFLLHLSPWSKPPCGGTVPSIADTSNWP